MTAMTGQAEKRGAIQSEAIMWFLLFCFLLNLYSVLLFPFITYLSHFLTSFPPNLLLNYISYCMLTEHQPYRWTQVEKPGFHLSSFSFSFYSIFFQTTFLVSLLVFSSESQGHTPLDSTVLFCLPNHVTHLPLPC